MTSSNPTLLDDISEMLGGSFGAVFATTLDLSVEPDGPGDLTLPAGEPIVCGSVGFEGELGGMIHVSVAAGCARALASRMLGTDAAETITEQMVDDVVGEIGNMAVGAVKSLLCDRELPCQLTIPVVARSAAARSLRASGESRRIGFASAAGHVLVDIELDAPGSKLG
jgi:CheY-specific phosphatase CheX